METERRSSFWTRGKLATLIAVGAVASLVAAVLLKDDALGLSIFAGLATTLAVAIPLFYVERLFEQQLTEATENIGGQIAEVQTNVNQRVDEVQTAVNERVDELSKSIDEEIERRRAADADADFGPARSFGEQKSFDSLHDALGHSATQKTIRDSAVFVPMREHELTVRFSLGDENGQRRIDVVAVRDIDRRRVPCVWSANKPVQVLIGDLDTALRHDLGDEAPDGVPWAEVLDDLAETLKLAEQRRVKAGNKSIQPLLMRIGENWFVTDFTLVYSGEPPRTFELDDVFAADRLVGVPDTVPDSENAKYAFAAANRLWLDHDPYT
jgi:hypothetical protein